MKGKFVLAVLVVATLAAVPAFAGSVTVTSNTADTLGAPASANNATFSSSVLADLSTGNLSLAYSDAGITNSSFVPALTNVSGTFTAPPPLAPGSTTTINFAGSVSGIPWGNGPAGFFENTFTLPTGATGISLQGAGNVDDGGSVFLNGHLITSFDGLSEFGNSAFSDSLQSDFVTGGANTLVIADDNYGGGPSGAAYYATITYNTSAVPEPSSLLLLGTGLAGVIGAIRRKFMV